MLIILSSLKKFACLKCLMSKASVLALTVLMTVLLLPEGALAQSGLNKFEYESAPVLSSSRSIPRVLLVISKDHKMFQQAYNDFTDMDEDGRIDTGFNPSVMYYGYFDPKSCYRYVGQINTFDGQYMPSMIWSESDQRWYDWNKNYEYRDSYFQRARETIEDDSQEMLDALKKRAGIADYVKAARAVHYKTGEKIGICQHSYSPSTEALYSGNWLNYVSATRIDVIRKILYGGFRLEDSITSTNAAGEITEGKTLLESYALTFDSHSFGTDVLSDDRWSEETPLTNYYDISKYTPFPKPDNKTEKVSAVKEEGCLPSSADSCMRNVVETIPGKAHFFARTRSHSQEIGPDRTDIGNFRQILAGERPPWPVIMYILNANPADHWGINYNTGAYTLSVSGPTGGGRYFDWIMNERPNPSSHQLNNEGRIATKSLNVKVRVCEKNNFGDSEGCRAYPSGDIKPTGLLQTNGESGQMYFGLLTGSLNESTFRKGGVIRNHIDDLSSAVDPQTGAILPGGLIDNIDALKIAGANFTKCFWVASNNLLCQSVPADPVLNYFSGVAWGNPTGEMLFEAVRYFARLSQSQTQENLIEPTASYVPATGESSAYFTKFKKIPIKDSWSDTPRLLSLAQDCAKPVILLIAEEDTDFDGDDINGAALNQNVLSKYTGASASSLPAVFNSTTYLDKITQNEGLATSSSGRKYFFGKKGETNCSAKSLTSLAEVQGLCPGSPSLEGTYSVAAAAYYAHTHNFSPSADKEQFIDVYAVTMSGPFPALDIPVYSDDTGTIAKKMSILPASITRRCSIIWPDSFIIGFLNYYILSWDIDKRGTPYHIKIRVNFEDAAYPDPKCGYPDWDLDQLVEYEINLLTTGSTSTSKRNEEPYDTTSGQAAGVLKVSGGTYYSFKTPGFDSLTIEPSEVAGLAVSTWNAMKYGSVVQSMGYQISGSTRDGTYMEIVAMGSIATYFTPPTCNWPAGNGSSSSNGTDCGAEVSDAFPNFGRPDPKSQVVYRNFAFNSDSASGSYLPSPMYLAAKYGSFNDYNSNGVPDNGEWEAAYGQPKNYFQAKNISELPAQLEAAFMNIARNISTGTATAAAVDTILGGGVSIQTLYYPEYVNPAVSTQTLKWTGSVFGLFVDKWGNLREDSQKDGILQTVNGDDGSAGDYIVTFNSTKDKAINPPDCYHYSNTYSITRCFSPNGTQLYTLFSGDDLHPKNVHQLTPLFDTGQWLAYLENDKLLKRSRPYKTRASIANGQRRIYYGKPGLNGAPVTLALFNNEPETLQALKPLTIYDNWTSVFPDVPNKDSAVRALVEWIIGVDQPDLGLRPRSVGDPWSDNVRLVTWRLGDIINSKPIIVGTPSSNFDLLYRDNDYTAFTLKQSRRRQMVYFGANDGMLHAINLGFYGSLADGRVAFNTLPAQKQGEPAPSETEHELGAEVWAYIPTSLLPHLQWLPDPNYSHSYYVDLKPLVSDIKIDNEWRTVLLGGLRLGGRPAFAADPSKAGDDFFYSEVFCLDITDPENEPKLLWRYSSLEAGLTVGLPSFVSNQGRWYAVIPSGPLTDYVIRGKAASEESWLIQGDRKPYTGNSIQRARLIVLSAETGNPVVDFTKSGNEGYLQAEEDNSFFNNPFLPTAQVRENNWTNHTLYFGLTVSTDADGIDSGAVYRLQMADLDGKPLEVGEWKLVRFYKTGRPVTGAVNSTYDSRGNLWVVFGTGRLWGQADITPCSFNGVTLKQVSPCEDNHDQYIYGLKEDLTNLRLMGFSKDISDSDVIDVSGAHVYKDGSISGLQEQPRLVLGQGGTTQYQTLSAAIMSDGARGWKRKLDSGRIFYASELSGVQHTYEMVITQPKLISMGNGVSYMSFTSFQPQEAGCSESGYGFLYLVDTYTGLPSPATYDAYYTGEGAKPSELQKDEVAGVLTTGFGPPTEAYISVSAAGIKFSASAPDMSVHSVTLSNDKNMYHRMTSWREVLDFGFDLNKDVMSEGL